MPAAKLAAMPERVSELVARQAQQLRGRDAGTERADGAARMMAAAIVARLHPFGDLAFDLEADLEGEHDLAAVHVAEPLATMSAAVSGGTEGWVRRP